VNQDLPHHAASYWPSQFDQPASRLNDPIALAESNGLAIAGRTWALKETGLPLGIFARRGNMALVRGLLAPLRAHVWMKMREFNHAGVTLSWPDIAYATGCSNHSTVIEAVKNLKTAMELQKELMK